MRRFDVFVTGTLVLQDFDVFKAVSRAMREAVRAQITDLASIETMG